MYCCTNSVFQISLIIFALTYIPASLCCPSGYQFTLIPPLGNLGLTCDPFLSTSVVIVVCEITGNEPVEIDWYFNSSSTLSETKLMNTSKHSIQKQYMSSSNNILKSVLTLQNLNNSDVGQYICSGHLSSGRFRLLPRPTLVVLSPTSYLSFDADPCKAIERKSGQSYPCADLVSVSPPLAPSSHVIISDQITTTSSLTAFRSMETAYFVTTSSILTTTLSPANLSSYVLSTNVPLPTFTSNIIKSKLLVTPSPMPKTLTGLFSASTNIPVPTYTTESKLLTTFSPTPTSLIGLSSITTNLLISNITMHTSPVSSTISTSSIITRLIIKSRLMHTRSIDLSSYTASTTFLTSSELTSSDFKTFPSPTTITQIQPPLLSTNVMQSIFSPIIPQLQPPAFEHQSSDILIWVYLITVLLVAIFLVMIISLITMVICLYVRGTGSFQQTRHETVGVIQRLRKPSDPLPPIRDSLILQTFPVSDTESSFISGGGPSTTIIHCAPLQHQLNTLKNQSLQDIKFNLGPTVSQCPSDSSLTVYAEVGPPSSNPISDSSSGSPTITSCLPIASAANPSLQLSENIEGTYSSSAYTLPDDAYMDTLEQHHFSLLPDTNGTGTLSTTETSSWSPLLIRQDTETNTGKLLALNPLTHYSRSTSSLLSVENESGDLVIELPIDYESDTMSQDDCYYSNRIMLQQGPKSDIPRQTHSLAEQSFSLSCPLHYHSNQFLATHRTLSSSLLSDVIFSCQPDNSLTQSQPNKFGRQTSDSCLFDESKYLPTPTGHYQPVDFSVDPMIDTAPDNSRSSSTSSGCTDLSKYSGDYERDPDYMRALVNKITSSSTNPSSFLNDQNTRETGVDSGLDGGLYSPVIHPLFGFEHTQEEERYPWQQLTSGYKSLDNLTRDPMSTYMKPFCRENGQESEHASSPYDNPYTM